MTSLIFKPFRTLTMSRFRFGLKSIAWAFENALIGLGAVAAAPLLYRGFDLHDGLATIENFIDHVIWRDNREELLAGLWWVFTGLFVLVCLLRIPAFMAMARAERGGAS